MGVFRVTELAAGLYRWTSRHPDWRPGARPESVADWPLEVGSIAYGAPSALVLVDPLIPEDARASFLAWLDRLVSDHGRPVAILTTIKFHRRSRDELACRYGASTSRARAGLPAGVRALPIARAGETMFWIDEHRALAPGDRILGAEGGGLRVCPDSWLGYLKPGITPVELRDELRRLLELPIEMILVSHGEPVLDDGRAALEAALRR